MDVSTRTPIASHASTELNYAGRVILCLTSSCLCIRVFSDSALRNVAGCYSQHSSKFIDHIGTLAKLTYHLSKFIDHILIFFFVLQLKPVCDDEYDSQALGQQMSEGSRKVELLPGMQLPVGVVYTPTSATVSLSALDISDLLHSKKYRVSSFNQIQQACYIAPNILQNSTMKHLTKLSVNCYGTV